MPAVFDRLDVRFEYPENWKLEDEPSAEGHAAVTVVSPSGAFWSLTIHSPSAELVSLLRVVLDALREEYQELDAEAVVQQIGETRLTGYDINFWCLDLTNTAQVRGFQTARGTYLLLYQAEDRDFVQVERVFLAITTSLVRGMVRDNKG